MRERLGWNRLGSGVRFLVVLSTLLAGGKAVPQTTTAMPPASLRDTGLYSSFETLEVDRKHLAFQPQYPLWTDGAAKRRWISLPPGTAVDGSDPDAWIFPVGTRLWKEFSFGGRPAETRYLERLADGQWLYAAYEWSADGREAHLAPERGRRGAVPLNGGRSHTIPGVSDCKVCHEFQSIGGARVQLAAIVIGHRPRRAPFRASAGAGGGSRVPDRDRPPRGAPGLDAQGAAADRSRHGD